MLKYIFRILVLWIISLPLHGQGSKFIPKSVSASMEVGNFFYSRLIENVDFRELTADIQIHKFLLVADYGYARFRQNEEFHNYYNEGNYFRAGADFNFIKKRSSRNIIFLGVRYCQSKFDESATYSINNGVENTDVWPENAFDIANNDVTGKWVEFVTGIKVVVFKGIQLGFTGRYKVLASDDVQGTFANYYIPGYGKRTRNSNWGVSYYIGYRFTFGKQDKNLLIPPK